MRHRVAATDAKLDKLSAIKSLKTVGCTDPNEAFWILVDTAYRITGQARAILSGKPGEFYL